jgi:signaling intermediate in Toll pathway protein
MEKVRAKSERDEALVSHELFEENKNKTRETFKSAIELFNGRDHRRRGSVEFIYAALKNMKQFGVNK